MNNQKQAQATQVPVSQFAAIVQGLSVEPTDQDLAELRVALQDNCTLIAALAAVYRRAHNHNVAGRLDEVVATIGAAVGEIEVALQVDELVATFGDRHFQSGTGLPPRLELTEEDWTDGRLSALRALPPMQQRAPRRYTGYAFGRTVHPDGSIQMFSGARAMVSEMMEAARSYWHNN